MRIQLKRAQLLGILLVISVLANVFLGILYMSQKTPSPGDPPLGVGRGVTRSSRQSEAERSVEGGEGGEGGAYETLEYDYYDQSVQALGEMRAQPQAQMGGRARPGAVTQRGGRTRSA